MDEDIGNLCDERQPLLPRIGQGRGDRIANLGLEVLAFSLALVLTVPVHGDLETRMRVEALSERAEDRVAAAAHRAGGGVARQNERKDHEAQNGARAARRKRLPVQDAVSFFVERSAGGTSLRRVNGSDEEEWDVIERAGRSEADAGVG